MRLAIADPPYLGRANRWYGDGRGHGGGRGRADSHDSAREWDLPERHEQLVADLERDFDGWAIAATPASLDLYLRAARSARVMIWGRLNSVPSGWRVASRWEPVIVRIPEGRVAHGTGLATADLLVAGIETRRGFAGAKPDVWTRWVLDALGYDPASDELVDMFPGSGAVAAAADGMLALATSQDAGGAA